METSVKAFAKLNLTLDVTGRAPDGYHDMLMIMQGASLCDELTVSAERGEGNVTVSSGLPYVPSDERNIAAKAARLFLDAREVSGWNVYIDVTKRIPVCAGLGGGSSDAAAVLRALNALFDEKLTAEELRAMSRPLGSDVPYCVSFGTMLAEGRGDILTPLAPLPECGAVICKPRFSVSTPVLFKKLDMRGIRSHPDTNAAVSAVERGDMRTLGKNMENVFERLLGYRKNEIYAIKETLLRCGAFGAVMSGTGSAVFGLFGNESAMNAACEKLRGRWADVFPCKTINSL